MIELWFAIVAVMFTLYVVLDGYDLGAGALHLIVARSPEERRRVMAAVGPFWDANEVWLIAGGGALFVAFPRVLAAGLSGFYLAIFMILWCLVLRGIALEFRSHLEEPLWRRFWDVVFAGSSALLVLLFGVALGNVIRGVPLTAEGWFRLPLFTDFRPHAAAGILDWFTLLAGAFACVAVAAHGATFLAWRTDGPVAQRSRDIALRLHVSLAVIWPLATIAANAVQPALFVALPHRPLAWLALAAAIGGWVVALAAGARRRPLAAFVGSCLLLAGLLGATAACMFPVMLPALSDPAWSITAVNGAAATRSLRTALGWWSIGFPIAIGYFVMLFRIHRARRAATLILLGLLGGCVSAERLPPTGGSVSLDSIPEAYARSTAALMWPAATRAFQITPEGDLYNGAWVVRLRPSAGDSVAESPPKIAFEQRWLPVAHWERRGGGVHWSFEAVAWPAPDDTNLFVSLLVGARNETSSPVRVRLGAEIVAPDSTAAWVAWDEPRDPPSGAPPLPGWASRSGVALAAGAFASTRDGAIEATLPPHGGRADRIVLSAYARPAGQIGAAARVAHERRIAEARAYWIREVARGARFDLGDPDVEHAVAAAKVTLLASRERRGERWFPIGGPFQYRDVWLRDGARAVQALAVTGYTQESRQLAAGLRSLQWESGAFMTQRGQPDGTGQAMWAFEQAALRPSADSSLGPFTDAAVRAWRWSETQRRVMAEVDPAHRPLMPWADPRDNEMAHARLVGTDAWTLAGYAAAARLAAAAGRGALAESIEASRRAYATAFVRSLAATHSADIPAAWSGPARDWGNIAALYPCRAGDGAADSTAWAGRSAALARRLWGDHGAGLVSYVHADSLHGYLGVDLGTWALLAGERDAADRVLQASLDWRSASGGIAELFSSSHRDFGRNLPPHATAAAALLVLVRNALIYDDGDRLMLTLGARDLWWRGSKVSAAPTRWGTIDLEFARHGDVAEWTWTPLRVPVLLRLPPGTVVAEVSPPLSGSVGSDHVTAPAGAGHASVRLAARAS